MSAQDILPHLPIEETDIEKNADRYSLKGDDVQTEVRPVGGWKEHQVAEEVRLPICSLQQYVADPFGFRFCTWTMQYHDKMRCLVPYGD